MSEVEQLKARIEELESALQYCYWYAEIPEPTEGERAEFMEVIYEARKSVLDKLTRMAQEAGEYE
jgi:hypothetical protein